MQRTVQVTKSVPVPRLGGNKDISNWPLKSKYHRTAASSQGETLSELVVHAENMSHPGDSMRALCSRMYSVWVALCIRMYGLHCVAGCIMDPILMLGRCFVHGDYAWR